MDLSEPPKRPRGESIVPMINVMFLLLIFFLMTSRLASPGPFEVTPPEAKTDAEAEAEPVLFVSAEGRIAFDRHERAQAIAALARQSPQGSVIQLRADTGLEPKKLAAILRYRSRAGLSRVELVVAQI